MTDTYNVYWTWNDKYDSQANWQQTVIRAESQKDAEQKAFEYMQEYGLKVTIAYKTW